MQIRNCLCDANILLYQDMIMRQRQMINKQCVTQNRKGQVSILVVKSHMQSCPKRFRCFCFTYMNFSDVAGVWSLIYYLGTSSEIYCLQSQRLLWIYFECQNIRRLSLLQTQRSNKKDSMEPKGPKQSKLNGPVLFCVNTNTRNKGHIHFWIKV